LNVFTGSKTMLLAIDIGNTNIHMGLWEGAKWLTTWRARTIPNKMGDEYAVLTRNFLHEVNLDYHDVGAVVIASVVPVLTAAFQQMGERYFKTVPLVVDHRTKVGVRIAVDSPEQVGPDRIVNAAAVKAFYPGQAAIVIDFGTATTFDVISSAGDYLGGAISPGINVALDALVSRTARLHKIDLLPPPSPIGRSTDQAMQSGIFLGYVCLVEGLVARIKAALPPEEQTRVKVLGTGGLAALFQQNTTVIDDILDALTLDGLRIIWELNQKG
jgi:type III pantothenate kinase